MSIANALSKVLDLPQAMAFKEAQHKLVETYLFVNGVLERTHNIEIDYLHIWKEGNIKSIPSREIKELQEWLPDTGVYFSKNDKFPVLLTKMARRQWKRSFSESFYDIQYLTKHDFPIDSIDIESRTDFWNNGKDVYWRALKVGHTTEDGSVICTYPFIQQELSDWLRRI